MLSGCECPHVSCDSRTRVKAPASARQYLSRSRRSELPLEIAQVVFGNVGHVAQCWASCITVPSGWPKRCTAALPMHPPTPAGLSLMLVHVAMLGKRGVPRPVCIAVARDWGSLRLRSAMAPVARAATADAHACSRAHMSDHPSGHVTAPPTGAPGAPALPPRPPQCPARSSPWPVPVALRTALCRRAHGQFLNRAGVAACRLGALPRMHSCMHADLHACTMSRPAEPRWAGLAPAASYRQRPPRCDQPSRNASHCF